MHDKDNVDSLNNRYCELTALYYLYKHNLNEDILGVDQYKRAFKLSDLQIKEILRDNDIIVHQTCVEQKTRLYHLENGFGLGSLSSITKQMYAVIKYLTPNFADSYMSALQSKQSCQHNMFICKKRIFDLYCSWLFNVLDLYVNSYDISKTPLRSVGHVIELTGLNTFISRYGLKLYDAAITCEDSNGIPA